MSGSPKDILGTADLSGVRNDSSYSPDVVRAHLNAHGVTLDYGKLSVIVEQAAVDDAERAVAAATPEDRRIGMWKAQKDLDHIGPKLLKGKFTREAANRFFGAIVLWHALKKLAN